MGVVSALTDKYELCLNLCAKCTQACYECFKMCLNETDVAARRNCIGILIECALSCQQAVAYMSIDADFAKDHCKLCATICDKCAQECDMFQEAHCKECANICRQCANECRKMVGM